MTIHNKVENMKFTPVQYAGKRPLWTDWPNQTVDRHWFDENSGNNIGLVLGANGNNFVDIDLDHEYAIRLAETFLPQTSMVFGRKSKKRSHYIYQVSDCGGSKQFEYQNMGMIVEYRSNRAQTVYPGSVHVSGEEIEFDQDGTPATVSRHALLGAVGKLAAACLIASKWHPGSRHKLALALSGTLLRYDWTMEQVETFIRSVTDITHDEERQDPLNAIRRTAEKIKDGAPYLGYPALKDLIGSLAAEKFSEWVGAKDGKHEPLTQSSGSAEETKYQFTDAGNAKWFAEQYGDKWVYDLCAESWFCWNGKKWESDFKSNARLDMIEAIQTFGSNLGSDLDKTVYRHRAKSLNLARLNGALEISQGFLAIKNWDSSDDERFLNVGNGLLNLENRELIDHDPKYKIQKLANVDFEPNAECPLFDNFMKDISCGDPDVENIIIEILGYCLISGNESQLYFIFFGSGANGKGVLIETVKAILGDYAATVQPATFMESVRSGAAARPDLARLKGIRAAFTSEGKKGDKFDEALVKQLTGCDTLATRELFAKIFEFKPEFKIILSSNYLPIIRGTDKGIWRRVFPVPFDMTLEEDQIDIKMSEKLLKEKSGILNRLLDGLDRVRSNGFTKSKKVDELKNQYRVDSNNMENFYANKIKICLDSDIAFCDLYTIYANWCGENGEKYRASNKEFNAFIRGKGIESKRSKNGFVWNGIKAQ